MHRTLNHRGNTTNFARNSMYETLEDRRLYSASPTNPFAAGANSIDLNRAMPSAPAQHVDAGVGGSDAMSLGTLRQRSKANANGTVGMGVGDTTYAFDVSEPLTLKLKLSKLKQTDQMTVLFADGTVISSTSNYGAASAGLTQRLDPGSYLIDISNGVGSSTSGSRGRRMSKGGNPAAFRLAVAAGKPLGVAPQDPQSRGPGGAILPSAGFGVEPMVDATVASWTDVSSDPLWGANGPSPDDIRQGNAQDCYFLASLSDMARSNPALIESRITDQGNGTYAVRFEQNGQDVYETVDAQLPVDANGNLVYAHLGNDNATWVAIMEKAFTYFRHPERDPSYLDINFGWSEEVFTDFGATDAAGINANQFYTGGDLTNEIAQEISAGKLVTLASNAQPATLEHSHMYSVVAVNADGTILLRNPWGFNRNSTSDGGYLSLTGDQALADMVEICSASFPYAPQPQPAPQPTNDPTPTDPTTTDPTTPTDPTIPTDPTTPTDTTQPQTYITSIDGNLGGADSYTLDDGSSADVFIMTATADGTAGASAVASDIAPQLQVLRLNADGSSELVGLDANNGNYTDASTGFDLTAGDTYEVIVTSVSGANGQYTMALSGNLANVQQVGPSNV